MSQQQTDHLEAFGHLGQTGGHGTRGVGSSPAPASSLEVPREGAMGRVEVGLGGGGGGNGREPEQDQAAVPSGQVGARGPELWDA